METITRVKAHGLLRGLYKGNTENVETVAQYLLDGGAFHWRNAAIAVDKLDPDSEQFEDCRELIASIRVALAYGDISGLQYWEGK